MGAPDTRVVVRVTHEDQKGGLWTENKSFRIPALSLITKIEVLFEEVKEPLY